MWSLWGARWRLCGSLAWFPSISSIIFSRLPNTCSPESHRKHKYHHIHAHTCIYIHTSHIYTLVHPHTHVYTYTHTDTYYIHTDMHIHPAHTHITTSYTHPHTSHTLVYTHTIHIHIQTHIHTQKYSLQLALRCVHSIYWTKGSGWAGQRLGFCFLSSWGGGGCRDKELGDTCVLTHHLG